MKPERMRELITQYASTDMSTLELISFAYREGLTDAAEHMEKMNDAWITTTAASAAILALRDELSSETGDKSKGVAR